MKWDKVREIVQERFIQTHPLLANPQLAAENMESAAIVEEMFSQITSEECEKRWSVIRKFMTNAQIAKTFPPWTDHEVRHFSYLRRMSRRRCVTTTVCDLENVVGEHGETRVGSPRRHDLCEDRQHR